MLLIFGLFAKWVHATICTCWSLIYLTRSKKETRQSFNTNPDIYIIIPLLREQKVLPDLFERFTSLLEKYNNLNLVLVTTEREIIEEKSKDKETTIEIVRKLIGKSLFDAERLMHIHYPKMNRVIAEQLNYALDIIANRQEQALNRSYLLIYNADSIIDEYSIQLILNYANSGTPVAQQSSLFLWNVPNLIEKRSFFLAAHGLRQSRWTLHYEIPRYLLSKKHLPWLPRWIERIGLVHCVGHGLLIRCDVITAAGGFPIPRVGLEDLGLGFILKALNYHVEPIPNLENAETPDRLKLLWRQKATWFWGPLGYLFYRECIPKKFRHQNKGRIAILIFQGLLDTANWLLAGPLILFFFYVSLNVQKMGLSLFLYILYVYTPIFCVLWLWNRLPPHLFPRSSNRGLAITLFIYPLIPILHSFPAFQGLWWGIKSLRGCTFTQPKTERS